MKWAAQVLAGSLFMLGACSSSGTSLTERLAPELFDLVLGDDEVDPAVTQPLPRAALVQIPFPTISLQTEDDGPIGYAVAQEVNGPYVIYRDSVRRGVTMAGGLVTGTAGLGRNVKAVKTQANDPVAVPTALSDWPARVTRSYQFSRRGAADFDITVTCSYAHIAEERVVIFEVFYILDRIVENCTNGIRTFENTHWVDADTGFIWQSRQWLGPRQDQYLIKIIRRYVAP
ncbi:MAG: YjbF family lipoprotein [Pseudomonadota bacterium]